MALPKRKRAARTTDFRNELARAITEASVPSDEPLSDERLDEMVGSLLDAAGERAEGEASIVLSSAAEGRRVTRVAIVNRDMPFLVDSVSSTIAAHGLVIDVLVHPIVSVKRDDKGRLVSLDADGDGDHESLIYVEFPRVDARQRRDLARALDVTLADVRAAVSDWPRMRDAIASDAERVEDEEGAQLLRWFGDGMLTQLGHVTRHRDGRHSSLLGVCRRSAKAVLADASWDRAFAWFDRQGASALAKAPLAVKANRVSNVHRRVPLDLFIVPVVEGGTVTALSVHAGIWTSSALNTPPADVPRMRRQFAALTERLGFDPGGHTGKAVLHALTTLPHDLLIGLALDEVERLATMMSGLSDRPRPRLTLVEGALGRHLFAFVWLPRDMLSTQARLQIQAMLEKGAEAETLDWSLEVEGGTLAMLRFVLDIRESSGTFDEETLDSQLQAMLRGWSEAVERALSEMEDSSRVAAIASRYAEAFPSGYRQEYGAVEAARDITRMRLLAGGDESDGTPRRDARLFHLEGDEENCLRLKVYQHEGQLPLSDAVPALENFGFRVMAEVPTSLDDGRIGTIHDFLLALQPGDEVAPMLERADAIERAITGVLTNRAENDLFNRLVVTVGLDEMEVEWLRAMFRYLRQTGLSFTVRTVVGALAGSPDVTRALVDLFRANHDPDAGNRKSAAQAARSAIRDGLVNVQAINDDRLLRLYQDLIEAVLRTNAFAPAAREALALKIESAKVPGIPRPVPWREIFVYSSRVEGIHLRAGPVARGGLRWSDRRDDFRTEVLGLMKAQRVKNAVIVPTGAKGGFYPKLLPDPARDRDGWAAEGQASYEIFIRSLLSVTDNIVEGSVIHPECVVTPDGDDPYFVVAADKGTARFSDVANAIAESRDFWLGDAFASGGSQGYDHKAMGITARGAWVSVQRHFLEMGVDVQNDPIRVIGCGDMSGDVFGNGMLLSRAIKLVAAFDHRDIFLDPDPDPATSWNERQRLYDLPRSSWQDYDADLISTGGGVFSRSMKRIPLSLQMQALLDVETEELEPDALISAILRAQADLLWFGGIGTYVKSEGQNHLDVGDPANDTLRVDAESLRVKVIGEGANLGITQAGRIRFALAGGRINTDFIDNSAGVDCSDNEVNIKIALADARRSGRLSERRRNALLVAMTDEVAELVLEDNRQQTLALSVAERGGAEVTAAQLRLIDTLESSGGLDRKTEGLADDEALARRATDGRGLTRPELAILLSSTKLALQDAIENSALPDDALLHETLLQAFPAPMRKTYARSIEQHRLRREIIATKLANRIVNRLGMVHPFELAEEEGASLWQIAAAFIAADRLFDLDALWNRLENDPMDENARLLLFEKLAVMVRSHMADLLRAGVGRIAPSDLVKRLAKPIETLGHETSSLLEQETQRHSARFRDSLMEEGAAGEDAAAVAHLYDVDGAVGIAQLAVDTGIGPRELARMFTGIGARLGLDWAQGTAAVMTPSDPWERLLVAGLARDLQQMRLDFLRRVLRSEKTRKDPEAPIAAWLDRQAEPIRNFRTMVGRAESASPVTPAMLAQITSQARNLFAL